MESKLIIITGSQGSGKTRKAKELASYYKFRRPYCRDKKEAPILEWDSTNLEELKMEVCKNHFTILCIQKQELYKVIQEDQRREFLIIDMDYEKNSVQS